MYCETSKSYHSWIPLAGFPGETFVQYTPASTDKHVQTAANTSNKKHMIHVGCRVYVGLRERVVFLLTHMITILPFRVFRMENAMALQLLQGPEDKVPPAGCLPK